MRAYAANPIQEHLSGDRFRVYFSSRDDRQRSSVAFIEIDLHSPATVLRESDAPILGPGEPGTFDDAGISIGSLVAVGSQRHLYYMGWHLASDVPWRNTIGLAIAGGDDQPFRRVPDNPVMGLDDADPHTLSYPWVLHEGGRFRMWYGSNTHWGSEPRDLRHVIKYAESVDGRRWDRRGVALDLTPDEHALSRPCVVHDADGYRMWFSTRGDAYRIRCAASVDGLVWERTDEAKLDESAGGWDAEMVEYPCVFDHAGARYLLYCGNAFGRTGFGLAVLDR
jgi:hypothetical protein